MSILDTLSNNKCNDKTKGEEDKKRKRETNQERVGGWEGGNKRTETTKSIPEAKLRVGW